MPSHNSYIAGTVMFVSVRLGCLNFSIFKHKYFNFHIHFPHKYCIHGKWDTGIVWQLYLFLYDVLLFPSSCIAITHISLKYLSHFMEQCYFGLCSH